MMGDTNQSASTSPVAQTAPEVNPPTAPSPTPTPAAPPPPSIPETKTAPQPPPGGYWPWVAGFAILIALIALFRSGAPISIIGKTPIFEGSVSAGAVPGVVQISNMVNGKQVQTVILAVSPTGDGTDSEDGAWVKSGIKVNKGDLLSIEATGSVNVDLEGLYKAAEADSRPASRWNDPDGLDTYDPNGQVTRDMKATTRLRSPFRLMPKAPLGALICRIHPDQASKAPVKLMVGKNYPQYECEISGMLEFAVNDLYLYPSRKTEEGKTVTDRQAYAPVPDFNNGEGDHQSILDYYEEKLSGTLEKDFQDRGKTSEDARNYLKNLKAGDIGSEVDKRGKPMRLTYEDWINKEYAKRLTKWDKYVKADAPNGRPNSYQRVWIDDNIGMFYVTAKIQQASTTNGTTASPSATSQ